MSEIVNDNKGERQPHPWLYLQDWLTSNAITLSLLLHPARHSQLRQEG